MEENKVVENPTVEEVKKEENNTTSPENTQAKAPEKKNSTKTRDLTKLLVRKLLKNTKKELSLLIESPKSLKVVRE